ncbi:MAG: LysE family transporter [Pseudomonadota bacterium]
MTLALDPALAASFLTIAGIWLVTVVSPGPNFVATCHAALTGSRRAAHLVVAGIAFGTTIWAAASLLGLGLLFRNAAWLYQIVKILGALYLVYMGAQMIWGARKRPATTAVASPPLAGWRAFRRGLLVDLSNPKAAAFFTSLFAVAVPPTAPLWFDLLVISSVVTIAAAWYAIVALAMASGPVARAYRRAQRWVMAAAGALFVGFGLKLAAER